MIEYVKKADVLEIINSPLPRDIASEYLYELKGVWLDDDEEAETKGNWRLISSEVVSIPMYWPGQDKKESDVGMKSKYECRFCGFRKSWWHKKGITPDLYNFCPNCGKKMITEVDND